MNALRRITFVSIIAALFASAPGQVHATTFQPAELHDASMLEGNSGTTNMVFTVTIPAAQTVDGTVIYTTSDGTATAGSDYVATTGTLTIPAGQTSATFNVPIIGDTVPEPTETFTVKLSGNHNLTIGTGKATGTIINDDGPTLSIGDASVVEGNLGCDGSQNMTQMVFTVSLSQAAANDVDFVYSIDPDTTGAYPATPEGLTCGLPGGDYIYQTGGMSHVVIPAGQTSAQISVPIVGDTNPEFNETFLVDLSNVNFAYPIRTRAVGTIINDDGLAIAVNSVSTTEGNSGTKNLTFTVSLSQTSGSSVSVKYATADGTAIAGTDYVAKSGTLTIPFGQTTGTVSVQIKGNTKPEPNKTFSLNLSSPVNGALYIKQGTGTIVNDDGLNISIVPSLALIEGSQFAFTVTQSAVSATDTTFHFATADGTATAGSDYTAVSGTATIPAGQTTAQILVNTTGDKIPEANETFFVNLSSPTNAVIDVGQSVATIQNNDGPTVSVGAASAFEGNVGTTMMAFPVTLTAPTTGDVKVSYTTEGSGQGAGLEKCQFVEGTAAQPGIDYVATSGTATIPTGGISTTINVPIIGNVTPESKKYFCVELDGPADFAVVDPEQFPAVGTIINDDGPAVSIANASLVEGNSGTTNMNFTVTATQAAAHDSYIFFKTTDGTATGGTDYAGGTGAVLLPAGATSTTIPIVITGDTTPEANETFFVDLVPNPDYFTIGNGHATGTIINDDGPVLSIADASTYEGNSGTHTLGFPVTLSQKLPTPVTFQWYTSDGTATAGSDYVKKNLTTVTIPANTLTKSVFVTINGDTTPEPNETFFVNIGNASGATIIRPQATGTIIDDDSTPTLSITDNSITEGNSGTKTLAFTVSLTHPWTSDVSYTYATADGTATAGSDYVAIAPTVQTIPAGSTSAQINVTINGDTVPENNETFFVNLTSPTNATFAKSQGTGTIIDDDEGQDMAIGAVQGSGDISPVLGKTVTVKGIVTARTADGFMLQTPDGEQDADTLTSEGVFISTGKTPDPTFAIGAKVQATGVVQEATRGQPMPQSTMTQIASNQVKVLATNQSLPKPVVLDALPSNTVDAWERYEGMRVSIPALTVTGPASGTLDASGKSHMDGRFYGVISGTARPFREPGLDALDQGHFVAGMQRFDSNPERLMIDSRAQTGAPLLAADVGDTVTGLTGVLGYGDGAYQVWPDPHAGAKVIAAAVQRPVPVGGAYTIGQLHLGTLTDAVPNYPQRLAKAANAICAYTRSPAILGMQDVASGKVLNDVAKAVNSQAGNALFPKACAGHSAYQAVAAGNNGMGFLVSTAQVAPGKPRAQVLNSAVLAQGTQFRHADGSSEALYAASPMLLQTRLNAKDGDALEVTIVQANLLPIEGVNANAPGTHGWKTQGAYVDAKRQAQALWLANWLQARQASHPAEKLVVIGGFNAYAFNDGHADLMGVISGQPTNARVMQTAASPLRPALTNLTASIPAAQRYDRIGQGNAEATDHVLVNRALLDGHYTMRIDHARLNADFGIDNDDDFSVPMHTSMQDPMVLSLDRK